MVCNAREKKVLVPATFVQEKVMTKNYLNQSNLTYTKMKWT